MQVFKSYFKILKTMLPSIILYGIIFLTINILINVFFSREGNKQFEIHKVSTIIINKDGESSFISGLLEYLEDYTDYKEAENNEETVNDMLFYDEADLAIIIPEGFSEDFLSGGSPVLTKKTAPDSIGGLSVDNIINVYLNTAKTYLNYNPSISIDELNYNIKKSFGSEAKVFLDNGGSEKIESSNEYNLNYFNYMAYIIIASFIVGVSTIMLSFSNIEIRRRHHASPISIRSFNAQLILANFCFVFCYLFVFIVVGFLLNPNKIIDANTLLYWLNVFVFSIAALSISYLIGITVKSRNAIQALSTIVSLGFSFITGVFVPQELLGDTVIRVASFMPSYWFIRGNKAISSIVEHKWNNLSEVFTNMAIQIGIAAAIFAVALVISKKNSHQAA